MTTVFTSGKSPAQDPRICLASGSGALQAQGEFLTALHDSNRKLRSSVNGGQFPRKYGVGKQSDAVIRDSQLTALNFL